ncbi:MAG TPA: helix-turn-helix domain-containing protein [Ktedonobacteraceae bacterium]|nr:helix-turn-helix domain-containing protein [Ktedonobacteraceae bacterium]
MTYLGIQIGHLQEQMGILAPDTTALIGPGAQEEQSMFPDQRAPLDRGRAPVSENQRLTTNGGRERVSRENTSDLILTTLLRLGVTTPDARIAREVGCSRRTVARWKKRFQAQGLLSAPEKRGLLQSALHENDEEVQINRGEPASTETLPDGTGSVHRSDVMETREDLIDRRR